MGRKNRNASERSTKVVTPHQLKREAERARHLLRGAFEPYDRPKSFSNPLSEYVSREALEELKSTYWKE
jgi:hypothetical protein